MRNDITMMKLIMDVAKENDSILAVYMNGSRVNEQVKKDALQDYDIVYVVKDVKPFLKNKAWLDSFGKRLMMQEPSLNDNYTKGTKPSPHTHTFLMLFKDGNRIDLTLECEAHMLKHYKEDSLTQPLLDKHKVLPTIPKANDSSYYVKQPTPHHVQSVCNDFWWCTQNVAKGLVRDELPYAISMYHATLYRYVKEMLEWMVGIKYDYIVSVGKMGKFFKRYVSKEHYKTFSTLFLSDDNKHNWQILFKTCDFFSELARSVSKDLEADYNAEDEANMRHYLEALYRQQEL